MPSTSVPQGQPAATGSGHGVTLRDLFVAVVGGLVVLGAQAGIDDKRDAEADRRENLRFIREQSANGNADKVSFRGIDLSNRNLGGLNLEGADLQGADLSGADLTETHLQDADLSHANLSGTVLEGTLLHGAELRYADLRNALLGANFNGASLSNTDMRGIRWSTTTMASHPFEDAQFYNTNFSGVSFPQINFDNYIEAVNFEGADLSQVDLPTVYGWPPGTVYKDDPSPRISSVCYDAETKWPSDFPEEHLEKLQCQDMHEKAVGSRRPHYDRLLTGATP